MIMTKNELGQSGYHRIHRPAQKQAQHASDLSHETQHVKGSKLGVLFNDSVLKKSYKCLIITYSRMGFNAHFVVKLKNHFVCTTRRTFKQSLFNFELGKLTRLQTTCHVIQDVFLQILHDTINIGRLFSCILSTTVIIIDPR